MLAVEVHMPKVCSFRSTQIIIQNILHKKQRHTYHADDCANDLPDSDFLMEKKGCREVIGAVISVIGVALFFV